MKKLRDDMVMGCRHTSINWEAAAMPTPSAVEPEAATAYVKGEADNAMNMQAP